MTKRFSPGKLKLLLPVLAVLLAGSTAHSQESQPFSINNSPLGEPTGFVNDYASVIDADTKQQLEAKLKTLRDTTNPPVEIAVVIVNTTGDRPIFEYSLAVARGWKIGSKEDDNPSALLMVAIDDRKYFTQVSKDLEDELPDGLVGSLQRQHLVPEFRKGNYGKGISDTLDAYLTVIQNKGGGATAPQQPAAARQKSSLSLTGVFCCGAIILVIILLVLSRSRSGRKDDDDDSWGGGAASALPWVIGSILANSGSSSGSSGGWGGSDGGASDWGGFGGGGDFGGGGAGGDW